MRTRRTDRFPALLEATRQRLEQWRRSPSRGRRIPEPLWAAAVKLAEVYGVSRISSVLGVNYQRLKRRLPPPSARAVSRSEGPGATFVELAAPTRSEARECLVEFEDARGAKMRIHLPGVATPDLVALSRSFWES